MSDIDPHLPEREATEAPALEDAADIAPRDSEIDFDDEQEDEVGSIDVVEAIEVGALLDDPEDLDEDDERIG